MTYTGQMVMVVVMETPGILTGENATLVEISCEMRRMLHTLQDEEKYSTLVTTDIRYNSLQTPTTAIALTICGLTL